MLAFHGRGRRTTPWSWGRPAGRVAPRESRRLMLLGKLAGPRVVGHWCRAIIANKRKVEGAVERLSFCVVSGVPVSPSLQLSRLGRIFSHALSAWLIPHPIKLLHPELPDVATSILPRVAISSFTIRGVSWHLTPRLAPQARKSRTQRNDRCTGPRLTCDAHFIARRPSPHLFEVFVGDTFVEVVIVSRRAMGLPYAKLHRSSFDHISRAELLMTPVECIW